MDYETHKIKPCFCTNHLNNKHDLKAPTKTEVANNGFTHARSDSFPCMESINHSLQTDIFADINNVSAFITGPGGSLGTDMSQFNPRVQYQDSCREKQHTDWNGVMQDLFYNLDNVDLGMYT